MVAMEPEQLEHLDRIGALLDALISISWLDDEEIEPIAEQLLGFDGTYWSFL